ncbi:MAG: hypothetical protein JF616_11560 [Fibrobacteres bacterium]|jgi:hypothetical protein|nr:hypothetical protein [Fibrobacterota bacterium]
MGYFRKIILANLILFAALAIPRAQSDWTPQVSGTTARLSSVIWAGNQLVTVGDSGTILTSPDGVTWTSRSSGTSKALYSIAWTGSKLVAVGDAVLLVSTDEGVNWTLSAEPTALYSVIWTGPLTGSGSGQLVVVGKNGAIGTSPDGVTWTLQTSGTTKILGSVAWTGSELVAVGEVVLTSPDGVTWTPRTLATTSKALNSVVWAGSELVIVGDGDIQTSPDGVTWTSHPLGSSANNLAAVVWTGSQLVAAGNAIATSPDGMDWTTVIPGTGTGLNLGGSGVLLSIAWTGDMFVVVAGKGEIATSQPATTSLNPLPRAAKNKSVRSSESGLFFVQRENRQGPNIHAGLYRISGEKVLRAR